MTQNKFILLLIRFAVGTKYLPLSLSKAVLSEAAVGSVSAWVWVQQDAC